MSNLHVLSSLTESEAVIDSLYRAISGFDDNDISLLKSACCGSEFAFEMNGNVFNVDQLINFVGPLDTTHMISGIRVDLKEGALTASLTANALAQHCPPGRGLETDGPKFLAGGKYFIDLVKDNTNGLWKIKKWVLKTIWRQGEASVLES